MEIEFTSELLEKAKQTKSAEELLVLANENGIKLSAVEAKEYFEHMNKSGELSDDELDNVSGGCGDKKETSPFDDLPTVDPDKWDCVHFKCAICGKEGPSYVHYCYTPEAARPSFCSSCAHSAKKSGVYKCGFGSHS